MGNSFYERIVWLRSIVKALCEIRRVGGAFSKGFRCFLRFYGSFIGRLGQKVIPKAEKIEIW